MKVSLTIVKASAAGLIFLALSVFLFYFIAGAPVNYNEHDYITQAVLWQDYRMYKDFCYVHMPWLPIIYGAFYKLTGTTYYLLAGRCFTLFFTLLSALVVFLCSYRFSRAWYFSLLMAALLCLNNYMMFIMMESSNYMMPLAFALLAYYFFIIGVSGPKLKILPVLLGGFFISAAAGARLLYAPLAAAFVFTGILYPRSSGVWERVKKIETPLALGMLAGQAPTIYYLAVSFNNFIFNNLVYHRLITEHKRMLGNFPRMTLARKFSYCLEMSVKYPEISLMMAGALVLLVVFIAGKKYYKIENLKSLPVEFALTLSMIAVISVVVFFPTPMWRQYFATPMPFVLILAGLLTGRVTKGWRYFSATFFLLVLVITLILQYPGIVAAKNLFANFDGLTSIRVHKIAFEVREAVKDMGENDKVATLFPIFVLESKLNIYNELATGPFIYEIGDMIPVKYRKGLVYASPKTIFEVLDREPPKAMLVSDTEFDYLLLKYAQKRNYLKLNVILPEFPMHGKFSLYLRPDP